jgi:hypothetical protein
VKKVIIAAVCVFSIALAQYGELSMSDLESNKLGGGLSVLSTPSGNPVVNLGLKPNLKFGDFGLGLDVNFAFPEDKRPAGLEWVVFRYAEYDNGVFGVRYGLLSNVTYGYGLVVDSYTTMKTVGSAFTPDQGGFKAYSKNFAPIGIYALSTAGNVYGARLTYDLAKVPVIEKPLVLGGSYMTDTDGTGTNNVGIGVYTYGADLGVKIIDNMLDVFVEYGSLNDATGKLSSGIATGMNAKFGSLFDLRFELRNFEANFIPGYFNSTYEISPVDLSTVNTPAMSGYFGGIMMDFLGYGKASIGYTAYDGQDPLLKGALAFKEINKVSGILSYEKQFPNNDEVISGKFFYSVNSWQQMVVNYRKVGNQPEEYTYEYQFNLDNVFF